MRFDLIQHHLNCADYLGPRPSGYLHLKTSMLRPFESSNPESANLTIMSVPLVCCCFICWFILSFNECLLFMANLLLSLFQPSPHLLSVFFYFTHVYSVISAIVTSSIHPSLSCLSHHVFLSFSSFGFVCLFCSPPPPPLLSSRFLPPGSLLTPLNVRAQTSLCRAALCPREPNLLVSPPTVFSGCCCCCCSPRRRLLSACLSVRPSDWSVCLPALSA